MVLTNGMPIGVPEAIGCYFLDRVIAGAIVGDWLKLYGEAFAGFYVNPSKLAGKTRHLDPDRRFGAPSAARRPAR